MEAIFFLFGLGGIVLVMHWAAVNDRAGNHGKTTGLFAMRDEEDFALIEAKQKAKTSLATKPIGAAPANHAARRRRGF